MALTLPTTCETGGTRSTQRPLGAWNGTANDPPGRSEAAHSEGPPTCVVANVPSSLSGTTWPSCTVLPSPPVLDPNAGQAAVT